MKNELFSGAVAACVRSLEDHREDVVRLWGTSEEQLDSSRDDSARLGRVAPIVET